ncbi:rhomboid family intramembrane serine protease [Natronomonas gomsonensis]|uniref:rhomboid family intramembrane serine protease n=1 Tax=Natronomonas gomsonensis TaxID=1046043 RepID=UPI0020CA3894|nr:rhomboid family intramembrane serine protease [Natronomonas gomsonensis]MCY4730554.1 rhomboid family intramembrane serine protease [Natronomonas gomsonensis]
MALLPSDIIFYVVLIAPGFVAVMTAVSLAAIEDEISQPVLLIWSLVSSVIIDSLFLEAYQVLEGPIESFDVLRTLFFTPSFRADLILLILFFSVVVGIVYAVGILADLPGRLRRGIQSTAHIKYNPRQPWENFMKGARSIRIKTSDDELYTGDVVEWSRAGKPKEVRVDHPYRYSLEEEDYECVGGDSMLFLEEDIDRVMLREEDDRPSMIQRISSTLGLSPDEGSGGLGLSTLRDGYEQYREADSTITYLLMSLVAAVFLIEILVTGFRGLGSIQVFATGVFGVYPWIAWPLSPVLHKGILHFAASLVGLLVVGVPIETHWNWKRYTVFLVLTGYATILAGAAVLGWFSDQQVAFYGTSGIIYALAGYSLTHLPRKHDELSLVEKFAVFIGVVALLSVLIDPFTGPFFEPRWINGGHTSGFLIGAVIGWFSGNCS